MEIVKKIRKIISWRQNAHRWCSEVMFEYMLPNLLDPATDVHKMQQSAAFMTFGAPIATSKAPGQCLQRRGHSSLDGKQLLQYPANNII